MSSKSKCQIAFLYALIAVGLFMTATPVLSGSGCHIDGIEAVDPSVDFVYLRNQDGKIITRGTNSYPAEAGGCELSRTQIDQGGDRDCDVWECIDYNFNPGVDQRGLVLDTDGNPLTEKAVSNDHPNAYEKRQGKPWR